MEERTEFRDGLWVLNFACCFYMCWNEDWFDTYKVCDEGFGNYMECKVVGIGKFKLKYSMEL